MPKWLKYILIVVLGLALLGGAIYGILCLVRSRSAGTVNTYPVSELSTNYDWVDQSQSEGLVTTDRIQSVYVSATQQVTEIYVAEGQAVKTGDPILAFDTTLSDVQLERKRIELEQLRLDLSDTQKLRKEMDGYSVYSSSVNNHTEEDPVTPDPAPYMPYLRAGDGTYERPYIFLWNDLCTYDAEFFNSVLPKVIDPVVDPKGESEPSNEPDGAPAEGGEGSGEPGGESGGEEGGGESGPEVSKTILYYVVFEQRQNDSPDGELLRVWQMVVWRAADGSVAFTITEPNPDYDPDAAADNADSGYDFSYDGGVSYTWSELKRMKAEADQKILDLQYKIKKAQLEYDTVEYELSNGVVYSKIDGVVKTLREVDEALANNEPMVLISGGGGYYVEALLGEMELDSMHIGDTVTVQSWESGEQLEGTIVSISEYPADNSNYSYFWSQGNNNVSKYPFRVFLDEDAPLRENEYVYITFNGGGGDGGSSFYVQTPFIRQENGVSYVYALGADNRLEKRILSTGRSLWGSYIEVLSGVADGDYIAFPYGRDVKEGANAEIAGIDELYNGLG